MTRPILPLLVLAVCLSQPAVAWAQLTFEDFKLFNQLLTEPDGKPAYEKRLRLIGDAMEREAVPRKPPVNTIQVNLKTARIPAEEGVPFLLKRLDHPSETVRRTVLRMLGVYALEAKSAAPAVLEMMKQDAHPAVRNDAMLTLARLDPGNAKSAAAILERLGADDSNDAENKAALQALLAMARVVPKSAVPRIAKFQEHRATEMGVLAHELVGKILALERPTLEQLRTMKAIEWRKAPDQGYVTFATIDDAGNRADFAVPLLLDVLDSTPPLYLECVALDTLAKVRTGNPQALAALLDRITAKDVLVRTKTRMALQLIDLKEPAAVRALAAGLRHKDRGVRLEAAQVLRSWDEPGRLPPAAHAEMLAPLLEALAEVDDNVWPAQLEMYLPLLRRFGTKAAPAADSLVKLYQSEAYHKKIGAYSVTLRGKILAVLANVGVPESGKELVLEVVRKGPTNQADAGYAYAAAARAAATFADPTDAVPLLLPALSIKGTERALTFIDWSGDGIGKTTTVRLEAIRALAKLGPPADEALPLLRTLAEANADKPTDLEFMVQHEARRAYQVIAGDPLPAAKGVFADGKKEFLNRDERLQVKMTLKLRYARPLDVLKLLQQATKLTFTMDENIDPDIPVWASIHSVQTPAFDCMRQLASSPNVKGTWEDVGDGYRLVGKKKDEKSAKAKVTFPPFRDDSNDPLPEDPRLQKSLTIRLSDATVEDIVQAIREATGVKLTVENVDTKTPLYQSVTWSNTSAWSALRNVAESARVQGAWEKVGDGYRLRGTVPPQPAVARPRPPQPVVQPSAPPPVEASEPPARPRIALLLVLGLFTALVMGAALALILRLRRGT